MSVAYGEALPQRIAVIGAGAGGLCVARHLLAAGIRVTVFEATAQAGGLWVYGNGTSPAYDSLHLNSEAAVTAYPDFPFPPGTELYPDHRQVAAWLSDYARHFGVFPHIRFSCPVVSIQKAETGFVLQTPGGDEQFDAVVVASGHQSVPRHPPFAKDFTGLYLHAHQYRRPQPFAGKRVLVVGTGNSACDIAADIAPLTAATTMAARSPVLLMPRMFLGVPTARVLGRIEKPWMPWAMRRRIRGAIARLAHGRMEQWGFQTPRTPTHPAGHHLLMGHFVWGRVTARPGVRRVCGQEVEFTDGSRAVYDCMIAATGYEVTTPFLPDDLCPVQDGALQLGLRVVSPAARGLYFAGYFNVSGGANIRMMDDQARLITALSTGSLRHPDLSEIKAEIDAETLHMRRTYPDNPRYALELDPLRYRRQIKRFMRKNGVA